MTAARLVMLLLCAAWSSSASVAKLPELQPEIGRHADLGLALTDADERHAALSEFMGGRPTLLLLGYHRCPNLCGVAQLGLARSLAKSGLSPDEYSVVFASIDPSETPADARKARTRLQSTLGGGALSAWHFIVGSAPQVAALQRLAGASAEKVPDSAFYIHPVAISTLTADGRVARVLPGLDVAPRDLRLAIVEASKGKLGTLGEHVLLLCSGFDPATGRYTSAVMLGVRSAGAATLVLLGSLILVSFRRRQP